MRAENEKKNFFITYPFLLSLSVHSNGEKSKIMIYLWLSNLSFTVVAASSASL